jgi:outer membrane protein OmpA-like peptidoglycan-associated protein
MLVNRRKAIGCLVAALLGGPLMLANVAVAAEKPSATQIIDALKPSQEPLKRSLLGPATATSNALSASESRLLDTARKRAITIEERKELGAIADNKRAIDLEVNFDYDSAHIRPDAAQVLASLGAALQDPALKGFVVLVAGHTDARGGDAYNMDLSQRRAHAVRAFLIGTFKLAPDSIVAVGFGEERLKNPVHGDAPENRRVQVVNMTAPK